MRVFAHEQNNSIRNEGLAIWLRVGLRILQGQAETRQGKFAQNVHEHIKALPEKAPLQAARKISLQKLILARFRA